MAERPGFEPGVRLITVQSLSRRPLSTTQPPLRMTMIFYHARTYNFKNQFDLWKIHYACPSDPLLCAL